MESLTREKQTQATSLKLQNQLSAQKDYHELKLKIADLDVLSASFAELEHQNTALVASNSRMKEDLKSKELYISTLEEQSR